MMNGLIGFLARLAIFHNQAISEDNGTTDEVLSITNLRSEVNQQLDRLSQIEKKLTNDSFYYKNENHFSLKYSEFEEKIAVAFSVGTDDPHDCFRKIMNVIEEERKAVDFLFNSVFHSGHRIVMDNVNSNKNKGNELLSGLEKILRQCRKGPHAADNLYSDATSLLCPDENLYEAKVEIENFRMATDETEKFFKSNQEHYRYAFKTVMSDFEQYADVNYYLSEGIPNCKKGEDLSKPV